LTIRISLITIDSDSADPALLASVRELLERAAPAAVVVQPASLAETKPAPRETPAREKKHRFDPDPPAPLRVHVPQGAPIPKVHPAGTVAGVKVDDLSPAQQKLVEVVRRFGTGVSLDELATELHGDSGRANRTRVDMAAGPLVMAGKLARANGYFYPDSAAAAANPRKATKRSPFDRMRKSGDPSAAEYYDRIVAAYRADNRVQQKLLATELFGDGAYAQQKLQLMLRNLVASERLVKTGYGTYRPVGDEEKPGRELDEESEDGEEALELESNGQPDEDDDEELELE